MLIKTLATLSALWCVLADGEAHPAISGLLHVSNNSPNGTNTPITTIALTAGESDQNNSTTLGAIKGNTNNTDEFTKSDFRLEGGLFLDFNKDDGDDCEEEEKKEDDCEGGLLSWLFPFSLPAQGGNPATEQLNSSFVTNITSFKQSGSEIHVKPEALVRQAFESSHGLFTSEPLQIDANEEHIYSGAAAAVKVYNGTEPDLIRMKSSMVKEQLHLQNSTGESASTSPNLLLAKASSNTSRNRSNSTGPRGTFAGEIFVDLESTGSSIFNNSPFAIVMTVMGILLS